MSELLNPFAVFGYAGAQYFCDREKHVQKKKRGRILPHPF